MPDVLLYLRMVSRNEEGPKKKNIFENFISSRREIHLMKYDLRPCMQYDIPEL